VHKKPIRLSDPDLFPEPNRRLYLALGGGPDREPGKSVPKKGGKRAFWALFFLFKRI
jgi:hypothetical protein